MHTVFCPPKSYRLSFTTGFLMLLYLRVVGEVLKKKKHTTVCNTAASHIHRESIRGLLRLSASVTSSTGNECTQFKGSGIEIEFNGAI